MSEDRPGRAEAGASGIPLPGRTTPSARRLVRALALAALCGLVAYAAIDAALNFLPPHYSVISNAESDYGVGPYGWLMDANFVLRGLLSLAVAVAAAVAGAAVRPAGARRRAGGSVGLALLALWGIASRCSRSGASPRSSSPSYRPASRVGRSRRAAPRTLSWRASPSRPRRSARA